MNTGTAGNKNPYQVDNNGNSNRVSGYFFIKLLSEKQFNEKCQHDGYQQHFCRSGDSRLEVIIGYIQRQRRCTGNHEQDFLEGEDKKQNGKDQNRRCQAEEGVFFKNKIGIADNKSSDNEVNQQDIFLFWQLDRSLGK